MISPLFSTYFQHYRTITRGKFGKIQGAVSLRIKFRPHQRFLSGRVPGRNDRSIRRKIERERFVTDSNESSRVSSNFLETNTRGDGISITSISLSTGFRRIQNAFGIDALAFRSAARCKQIYRECELHLKKIQQLNSYVEAYRVVTLLGKFNKQINRLRIYFYIYKIENKGN